MRIIIITCFFLLGLNILVSQENDQFNLKEYYKSEYSVGFIRKYEKDSTRKYPLHYNPGKNNDTTLYERPIVINIWYPSGKDVGGKMETYKKYLSFNSRDPAWDEFLSRLEKFNHKTIKDNAFRYTILNDTIEENMLFESLLSLPINIHKNSEIIDGEFPLIILHPGLGGSIEEHSILCEYLASNGYLIISSAYQSSAGKIMHADWDLERSEKDIDFLIEYAMLNLPVKQNLVHLLGFSFGAQSNFNFLLKNRNIKSAVSLDSRLEYSYGYNPKGYKNLPQDLLNKTDLIESPLLLFTSQEASYTIIDSLSQTNRYYVMAKDFEHYDFTSIKQISNLLVLQKKDDIGLIDKYQKYKRISSMILSFFNFYTENPGDKIFSFDEINNDEGFYFETMKRGQSKSSLDDGCYSRNILKKIEQMGTIELVKESIKNKEVCFKENTINDFAYYLMSQNKFELSVDTLVWACELFPYSSNLYDSLGEAYYKMNNFKKAIYNYKKSLKLNPANENAVEMIKKIKS